MHEHFHDAWAWGFLDALDERRPDHPFNDLSLWTRVEIVLHGDGTIASVTTVRKSGLDAFDEAAREVVLTSGPFPGAPHDLVSGDGNVYLHWAFHRDERACGAFGATPFVLDRPQETATTHDRAAVTEATTRVANDWLHHVHAGNIDEAAHRSAVPFSLGENIVAATADELTSVLQDVRATMSERPKAVRVLSVAELCTQLGGLPRGVDQTTGLTPALTKVGGDLLVLLLEANADVWRVRGVAPVPRSK